MRARTQRVVGDWAFAFTIRARPHTRSAVMGLRFEAWPKSPLACLERLFRLNDVAFLHEAHLQSDALKRRGATASAHITCAWRSRAKHLRRQRIGSQAHFLADVLFDERARCSNRCPLHQKWRRAAANTRELRCRRLGALEGPSPAAELSCRTPRLSARCRGVRPTHRVFWNSNARRSGGFA